MDVFCLGGARGFAGKQLPHLGKGMLQYAPIELQQRVGGEEVPGSCRTRRAARSNLDLGPA